MRPRALGVIGLGPLGLALARQAKHAGVARVLGWSPEPGARVAAVREGAAHDAPPRAEDVAAAVDLLILALPVDRASELLPRIVPKLRAGALLTDTATVKRGFVHQASDLGCALRAAGSHPVVGSLVGLTPLRGTLVYVTPVPGGETAAREVAHLWESVYEAAPVLVDADRHDAQAALTLQLPHFAAVALASTLATRLEAGTAIGPEALSLTRPAATARGVAAEGWANRTAVAAALRALAAEASTLADALESRAPPGLRARLDAAARWREGQGG